MHVQLIWFYLDSLVYLTNLFFIRTIFQMCALSLKDQIAHQMIMGLKTKALLKYIDDSFAFFSIKK